MNLPQLKNKLIAVLNYGQEGRAVTKYLYAHGFKPVIFDPKPWGDWSKMDQEEIKRHNLNFIFGPDCLNELRGFDIAFRSPGLWRNHPRLLEEQARGMHITSQTKWFFEHCPSIIIGVTGTKGKGTTSALIHAMLKSSFSGAGKQAYLTGNIGQQDPFYFLDSLKALDVVVFELSSFQLQDLERSPQIAVVLMVTSEHLDTHASLDEYLEAKQNMVRYQHPHDSAIINLDYAASAKFAELTPAEKFFISSKKDVERGCYVTAEGNFVGVGLPGVSELAPPGGVELLHSSELKLRGRHNWENVASAVAAALIAGGDAQKIKAAAIGFEGLTHRLELVSEEDGISFYDDSLSTIPESTIAAINSFVEPVILILGGSEKKSDYKELGKTLVSKSNIRSIILIGETAGEILQAIKKAGGFAGKIFSGAKSMGEIFAQLKPIATPGDVVLLSPACASYDMFKDYADRGDQFRVAAAEWGTNA